MFLSVDASDIPAQDVEEIHLWSFDEDVGLWEDEGRMNVVSMP